MLNSLRKEQWEYYLNECLPSDKTILDKIEDDKPARRWISLCTQHELANMRITNPKVQSLVDADATIKVQKARKKVRVKSQ